MPNSDTPTSLTNGSLAKNGLSFKVIGIDGCTNAGKTTISTKLCEILTSDGHSAVMISQDDFFLAKEQVPRVPKKDGTDLFYHYDCPESVDYEGLAKKIQEEVQNYDFLIVEGNMLCQMPGVLKLLDRVVFMTLDYKTCLERREQRTYDPSDVPGFFDEIVWPSYSSHLNHAIDLAKTDDRITFRNGLEKPTAEIVLHDLKNSSSTYLSITSEPLDIKLACQLVSSPSCGAISTFTGTTRDTFQEKHVIKLDYEAYEPMAYRELRKLCKGVREKYKTVKKIAIFHRVGNCPVGEESVIIATSSPHRRDAIEATEMAIDELKRSVPIWKKEEYSDGTCSWKENSEFTDEVEKRKKAAVIFDNCRENCN